MKLSLSTARVAFLILLAAFGFSAGCNRKKINSTTPTLLTTVRVSLSSSGNEGNLDALNDSIGVSNDGRYVVFTSRASNYVANDGNNLADVFYRDNINRTLILISVNLAGVAGNGPSGSPSISGDGRYVAFASSAANMTLDAIPAGKKQIYVRDLQNNSTTLVSRASGATGLISAEDCNNPKISNDGVYVVWDTTAKNLDGSALAGDDNDTKSDIYRRKWIDGTSAFPTDLVSWTSGAGPSPVGGPKGDGDSFRPVISSDGRYIAFESDSTNMVSATQDGAPDNNNNFDVFVRDMGLTFRTVRCSVEYAGAPVSPNGLDGPSTAPTISLDGQLVAFRSTAGTLSILAQEKKPNVYVRSWNGLTPFTEVLSVHTSGATGGQLCDKPSISGDGSKITWQSPSPSLVNGDSNGVHDVFLRNRTLQATTRESLQTFGGQLDGSSEAPVYSADGRYIVFWSQATNAVDDDTNGAADIFMRGPPFK